MEELLKLKKQIETRMEEIKGLEIINDDLYEEYMDLQEQLFNLEIDLYDMM